MCKHENGVRSEYPYQAGQGSLSYPSVGHAGTGRSQGLQTRQSAKWSDPGSVRAFSQGGEGIVGDTALLTSSISTGSCACSF